MAHPHSPFTPVSAIDFGGAPIVAVTRPQDRRRRGTSPPHATAWSADAIRTLSVDNSRRLLSTAVVHPCGPVRSDAVTVTPRGIYAALADGSAVLLKGSKVTVPYPATGITATGYCAARDELWATSGDGSVTVIDLHHPHSCYTRTFGPVNRLYSSAGRLYAATASGVYDTTSETADSTDHVTVAWDMRLRTPRLRAPRRLTLWLQSPQASVTAGLRGDGGAGTAKASRWSHFVPRAPSCPAVGTHGPRPGVPTSQCD